MSSTLFRFILRRVARSVAKKGVKRAIEEATGFEVPGAIDALEFVRDELGPDPSLEEIRRVIENEGLERGALSPRQVESIEEGLMTDFNDFMSIGLSQCGSDRQTFAQLVEVWNREKDDIRQMSQAEVRRNLTCP